MDNSEIIVSSPYTRALQTAAIISKNRQLNIKVELDLHEWMPDLSFQYSSHKEASKARELCFKYKGVRPDDAEIMFENLDDVFNRAKKALLRYSEYKKIIVVTHGLVIRRFAFTPDIPFVEYQRLISMSHFHVLNLKPIKTLLIRGLDFRWNLIIARYQLRD